jgi:hypothetical protein
MGTTVDNLSLAVILGNVSAEGKSTTDEFMTSFEVIESGIVVKVGYVHLCYKLPNQNIWVCSFAY